MENIMKRPVLPMYLGLHGLLLTPNFCHQVSYVSSTKVLELWHPLQSPSGQIQWQVEAV